MYLIILTAFILRLPFGLSYLEDWDSVQLALGVDNFSIVDHQPHPPGYPFYILLGKLAFLFTNSHINALTSLSIIFGSLSVIPFYLLVKKIFGGAIAFWGSLLFIIIPIHWRLSEVALTDIPGFFFLLTAGYFIYLSKDSFKNLIFSALFAGLILGFRFNEIPVLLALLALVLVYQKKITSIPLVLGSFILGISLWLLPLIVMTGFQQFISSYSSLATYVVRHDVLLGSDLSAKGLVKTKLLQLSYLLNLSYTWPLIIISLLSLLKIISQRKLWKEFTWQFLLVWLIAYLTPLLLVYNLEHPRHLLPLLTPIVIITTVGLFKVLPNPKIFIPIFVSIMILIFLQSWGQVTKLKDALPPTIQPVLFVKTHFQPQETILITSYTYRQFQYYAPEFTNYYSDKINLVTADKKQTIIVDYLGLKDKIADSSKYEIQSQQSFVGDKELFTRIPEITLYILKKKQP